MIYDTIVIGGGPAGMTAALYLLRAGKSVLILEREAFGGQIAESPRLVFRGTIKPFSNPFKLSQPFLSHCRINSTYKLFNPLFLKLHKNLFISWRWSISLHKLKEMLVWWWYILLII